ncbi:hypothetical protein [Pedobacter kyonggii]|uniref:Uncharacterized protein n=1 Tax=Pedobacter kyonggii TaxID=1926871 RepID=A0A4Q9HH75_9SPHI|nr:hypothetical protein [Pedobacter kyonggii]TBO44862.1 hypothetical protein EYS08_00555 [Pedobacter kyonggii]
MKKINDWISAEISLAHDSTLSWDDGDILTEVSLNSKFSNLLWVFQGNGCSFRFKATHHSASNWFFPTFGSEIDPNEIRLKKRL